MKIWKYAWLQYFVHLPSLFDTNNDKKISTILPIYADIKQKLPRQCTFSHPSQQCEQTHQSLTFSNICINEKRTTNDTMSTWFNGIYYIIQNLNWQQSTFTLSIIVSYNT